MIHQDAMPPYTMHCRVCGLTWDPQPDRGTKVTAYALNLAVTTHWTTCLKGGGRAPGGNPDKEQPPCTTGGAS